MVRVESTLVAKVTEVVSSEAEIVVVFRVAAATSEKEALKRFGYSKRMKRMLLITRDGRLLDVRK